MDVNIFKPIVRKKKKPTKYILHECAVLIRVYRYAAHKVIHNIAFESYLENSYTF
jgi:hypothetical protein